jgi:hypothetical protein
VSVSFRQAAPEGTIPKKMPYSDSPASQHFRMAAAEMIMACKLSSHIFQRFYLPDSFTTRDDVKGIMDELYSVNPRREAIFRIQLLSGYKPQTIENRVANVVQTAVDEVVGILNPLLFTEEARRNYRSELEQHYQDGVDLWRQVQRNEKRVTVENSPGSDWDENEDYDVNVTPRSHPDQMLFELDPDPIMSLFPRLRIDDSLDPLLHGYALWSCQNTVTAGFAEYSISSRNANGHMSGGARGGRAPRRTERRESVVSNLSVGVGRADDAPLSPRAISGGYSLPGVTNGSRRVIQGGRVGVDYN